MRKSDANECNESSLSNCRVQLTLSTKKNGMILNTNNSNSTNFWELFGLLEMEVDFLQPFPDIEARTALANPGKVAMA